MTQDPTQEDIREILQAFELSAYAHLELTVGPVQLAADRAAALPPASSPAATACVAAPLLGVFQTAAEPGAPALVELGAVVKPDTVVGFIRTLDQSTAVVAGVDGTVVDLPVPDGQFVEFGQTLLRISPSAMAAVASGRPDQRGTSP
jgi:acetyl-CoA carboxylase biotin carboxyl carrier protein